MIDPYVIEWIGLIGNALIAVSATAVAIFTAIGVTNWRSEMRGKVKFDVAREIVGLIHQFCDQYARAREAAMTFQEYSERDKGDEEGADEERCRDELYARDRRIQKLYRTLNQLRETSWQAEIVFSKGLSDLLEPFKQAYEEVRTAVDIYCSSFLEHAMKGTEPDEAEVQLLEEYREVVYGTAGDNYSILVEDAVEKFISYLRKEL